MPIWASLRHCALVPSPQAAALQSTVQASGSEISPSSSPSSASHWASVVSWISGIRSEVTIWLPSSAVLACTRCAMKVATRPV